MTFVLGSYRLGAKLAEGGMGAVYRATHVLLDRPAAVKVLLPAYSSDHDVVERFFNEARAATAIRHPGIVEIYDFGYTDDGIAYLVMELLDGESLAQHLARVRVLDEQTAVRFARAIASALAAAHAKGIVHRDLKPDNVFLVPDADVPGGLRVKLLDFGIAKVTEAVPSHKTRTGSVLGTPAYMSPEQCRGAGEVDHRSDLYSLGCILFEMLAGRPPFTAEGAGELLAHHQMLAPPRLEVSARLEPLVMALLAKDPRARVQSAAEVGRMLGSESSPMVALPLAAAERVTVALQPPTTLDVASGEVARLGSRTRSARIAVVATLALAACAIAWFALRSPQPAAAHIAADAAIPDAATAIDAPAIDAAIDATVLVDAGSVPDARPHATSRPRPVPHAHAFTPPPEPPDAAPPPSPHSSLGPVDRGD